LILQWPVLNYWEKCIQPDVTTVPVFQTPQLAPYCQTKCPEFNFERCASTYRRQSSLGANTLPELITLVKKASGWIAVRAANRGGQSHLTEVLLSRRADMKLTFGTPRARTQRHRCDRRTDTNHCSKHFRPCAWTSRWRHQGNRHRIGKAVTNMPDLQRAETIPGFQSHDGRLMAPTGSPRHRAEGEQRLAFRPRTSRGRQKLEVLSTFIRILSPVGNRRIHPQRTAVVVAHRYVR